MVATAGSQSRESNEKAAKSIAIDSFHKILIVYDGAPEDERAAELGLRLAAKIEAEVILLGIVKPPTYRLRGRVAGGRPVDPTCPD